SHMRVAFRRGRDDTPRLAGTDDEIVVGIVIAASDAVLAIVGVADGVLIVDLVAAAREETAFIHLDDVAGAFEHPLDTAMAARLAVLVVDGGNDDVLRLNGIG